MSRRGIALVVFVVAVVAAFVVVVRRGTGPLVLAGVKPRYQDGRGGIAGFRVLEGGILRLRTLDERELRLSGSPGRALRVYQQRPEGPSVIAQLPALDKAALLFLDDGWELISGGHRLRQDGRIVAVKALQRGLDLRYFQPSEPEPIRDDFMREGKDPAPWTVVCGDWFLTAGADPRRSANPFFLAFGPRPRLRPDPLLAERTEPEKIGIGVAVGQWRGRDFVSRLSAQGPAARAGVEEEDIVISADGLSSRYGVFGRPGRNPVRMSVFRPSTAQVLRFEIPKEPYRWGKARRPVPLEGSSDGCSGLMAVGGPQWCEGMMAVSVRPGAAGAGGLAWRIEDSETFLAVRLVGASFDDGGARLEVAQFEGGTARPVAAKGFAVWPETSYRLATRLAGDMLSVSVDGAEAVECEVPAHFGRPGLCAWVSLESQLRPAPVHFDDFDYWERPRPPRGSAGSRESRSTAMTREEAMIEWAAARGEWRRSGDYFFYVFPLHEDFTVRVGRERRVLVFDESAPAWREKSLVPESALLDVKPLRAGAAERKAGEPASPLARKVGGNGFTIEGRRGGFDVHVGGTRFRKAAPGTVNWFGLAVERLPDESAYPNDVTVTDEGTWDDRFEEAPSDLLFLSGFWGVANKWVCDPRFSWLAGRSSEAAQAWWKGRLRGDFTLDFYIATFMELNDEPFERNGDLGIALSSKPGDLGGGYFLSIGEDFDTVSRFYRLDKVLAETRDERLQPPSNHLYLPLRQEFHRRWTHIRLSRRGNRLVYEIDGKRALSAEDLHPLDTPYLALMCQRTGFLISRMRLTGDIEPEMPPEAVPSPPTVYDDGEFTNLWAGVPQTRVEQTEQGLEVEQAASGPMLLVRKTPIVNRAATLVVRLKPLRGDLRLGAYVLPYNPPLFRWGDEYGDGVPTHREGPPGPAFGVFRPRLFDQGLLLYVPLVGEFPDNAPFTRPRDVERRTLPDGTIEVTASLDIPYPSARYALNAGLVAVVGMLHLDEYGASGVRCNRPGSAYLLKCFEVVPGARGGGVSRGKKSGWKTAPFLIDGTAPRRWEGGPDVGPPGRMEEAVLVSRQNVPFLTPTNWAGRTRLFLEESWFPLDFPILELTYRAESRVAISPNLWPPGASLIWGDGLDDRTEWAVNARYSETVPEETFRADGKVQTARFNLLRTMIEGLDAQPPQGGMVSLCDEGWRGMYPGMGMELHGFRFVPVVSGFRTHIVPFPGTAGGRWRLSVDPSPAAEPREMIVVLPEVGLPFPFRRLLLEAAGVKVLTPASLAEGWNYVHVKTRDAAGRWGETEHWPFLVDREPPKIRFIPAPPGDNGLLFGWFEIDDVMGVVPRAASVEVKDALGRLCTYRIGAGLRWDPAASRLSLVRAVPPEWALSPVAVTLKGVSDTLGHAAPDFGPLEIWPHGSVSLRSGTGGEANEEVLREPDPAGRAAGRLAVFFAPPKRADAFGHFAPARVQPLIGRANYFEETLGQLRPSYNVVVERSDGAGLGGGYGGRVDAWPGEWRVELLQRHINVRTERFFVMSYRVEGDIERMHLKARAVGDRWAEYPVEDLSPGWHTTAIDLGAALDETARRATFPFVLRIDLVGECGGRFDAAEATGTVYLDALGATGTLRLRLACAPGHERVEAFQRLANDMQALPAARPAPLRIGIHNRASLPGRFLEVLARPLGDAGDVQTARVAVVDLEPVKPVRLGDKY